MPNWKVRAGNEKEKIVRDFLDENENWCIDGEEFENHRREFEIKIINDYEMLLPKIIDNNLFIEGNNQN